MADSKHYTRASLRLEFLGCVDEEWDMMPYNFSIVV